MTKQKWFNVGLAVVAAAALVLGVMAFSAANQPEADQPEPRGTTHFDDVTAGGYFIAGEQSVCVVGAQYSITPTGTYQPITSTAAVSTSLTTAIVSGTIKGQWLFLVNENASDAIIIVDGANTKLGGDKTLTGGQGDGLLVVWDEADWIAAGYNDN